VQDRRVWLFDKGDGGTSMSGRTCGCADWWSWKETIMKRFA